MAAVWWWILLSFWREKYMAGAAAGRFETSSFLCTLSEYQSDKGRKKYNTKESIEYFDVIATTYNCRQS